MSIKPISTLECCWNKLSRSYNSWNNLPPPRADIAIFLWTVSRLTFIRRYEAMMGGGTSRVELANAVSNGSPAPDEILERSLCQRRLFLQKGRRDCFQMHGMFKMIFSLILVYLSPNVPNTSISLLILQNQYHNLSIWTSVKLCLYHYNFATLNITFVISFSVISANLFQEEIIFYNAAMKAFYFHPCLGLGVWGFRVIYFLFICLPTVRKS